MALKRWVDGSKKSGRSLAFIPIIESGAAENRVSPEYGLTGVVIVYLPVGTPADRLESIIRNLREAG
jgi:hypothetical protein